MKKAWAMANLAQSVFGGKKVQYISSTMKLAWAEAKGLSVLLSLDKRKFKRIAKKLASFPSVIVNIIKTMFLSKKQTLEDKIATVFAASPITNQPVFSLLSV